MTCESARRRVRGVIWPRIASSASAAGRWVTSAIRTRAPVRCSGASSPGCSEFVVTTSSSGPKPKPAKTMLHPSVVELVRASRSVGAPISVASFSRTCERSVSMLSTNSLPPRPCSLSQRVRSSIAATVARERGPSVPAFRYANRSRTGNSPCASSGVMTVQGRVIGEQAAVQAAAHLGPVRRRAEADRARQDVVDPVRTGILESPFRAGELRQDARVPQAEVEVAAEEDGLVRSGKAVHERRGAEELGVGKPFVRPVARRVEIGDHERRAVLVSCPDDLADAPLPGPRESRCEGEIQPPGLAAPVAARVEDDHLVLGEAQRGAEQERDGLACERRAEEAVVELRDPAADLGGGG